MCPPASLDETDAEGDPVSSVAVALHAAPRRIQYDGTLLISSPICFELGAEKNLHVPNKSAPKDRESSRSAKKHAKKHDLHVMLAEKMKTNKKGET